MKQMREYDWNSVDYPADKHPEAYENQEHQHDLYTATVWALHLNVRPEHKDVVLERVSELPEATGEYVYGDSWIEWGSESQGDHDKHMAIYFKAEPRHASRVGFDIANHVHIVAVRAAEDTHLVDLDFAISTSGDWAEQARHPIHGE